MKKTKNFRSYKGALYFILLSSRPNIIIPTILRTHLHEVINEEMLNRRFVMSLRKMHFVFAWRNFSPIFRLTTTLEMGTHTF